MRPDAPETFCSLVADIICELNCDRRHAFDLVVNMIGHLLFDTTCELHGGYYEFVRKRANVAVGLALEHYYIGRCRQDFFRMMIAALRIEHLDRDLIRPGDAYMASAHIVGDLIDAVNRTRGKVNIVAPNVGTATVLLTVKQMLETDFSIPEEFYKRVQYIGYTGSETYRILSQANMIFSTRASLEFYLVTKAQHAGNHPKILELVKNFGMRRSQYICVFDKARVHGLNETLLIEPRKY